MPATIWLRYRDDVDMDRIEYHEFRNLQDASLWLMHQLRAPDLDERTIQEMLDMGEPIEDEAGCFWDVFEPIISHHV